MRWEGAQRPRRTGGGEIWQADADGIQVQKTEMTPWVKQRGEDRDRAVGRTGSAGQYEGVSDVRRR